jgi:hypothetical protein
VWNPVSAVLWICSLCKSNHTLSEKKIRWGSISPSWTDWMIQLQKFSLLVGSHDCHSYITLCLNGFHYRSFLVGSWFWNPGSYSECMQDLQGVCSSLASVSTSLSWWTLSILILGPPSTSSNKLVIIYLQFYRYFLYIELLTSWHVPQNLPFLNNHFSRRY